MSSKPAGFVEPGQDFYVQFRGDYLFEQTWDDRGSFLETSLITGHQNRQRLGNNERGYFDIHGQGFVCEVRHVKDYNGSGNAQVSQYTLTLRGESLSEPISLTANVSMGA